MDKPDIKCFTFSYQEVEDIMNQWNPNCIPEYEGVIVRAYVDKEPYEFAAILSEMHPELGISKSAISIYTEAGYIYTKHGVDVVVIDGIQEGVENEE